MVQSRNFSRMTRCINASETTSTLLVTSSRMMILLPRSKARANENSCLWPWEKKLESRSVSMPPFSWTRSHSSTLRRASMISWVVWVSSGSAFTRTVPRVRNGSCGIAFRAARSFWRGTRVISTPSIVILLPGSTSSIRNNVANKELFPLPLRPQIPIFSPARMDSDKSRITSFLFPSLLYAAETLRKSIDPLGGHDWDALSLPPSGSGKISSGRFSFSVVVTNSRIRATAPIEVSSPVQLRMMNDSDWLKGITFKIARPT